MLVPIRMVTNMAAGNQQKHVSQSCSTLRVNSSLEELINVDINTMTIQAKSPQQSHFSAFMAALSSAM